MNEMTPSYGSATSKLSPSATSNRTETPSRTARCFASSIIPGEMSMPVTVKPLLARKHESAPSPQPSSRMRSPGRNCTPQSQTSAARRSMNETGSWYSRSDQPRDTPVNFSAVADLLSICLRQAKLGQLAHGLRFLPAADLTQKTVPDLPMQQIVIVIHDELVASVAVHE